MNKKLLKATVIGIIFVSILGTLFHFIYEWSGSRPAVGLFSPVNESTWEHMKLLFFPMLLYSLFIPKQIKEAYPCILSALFSGILAGLCLIPILFYTYTGILGYHIAFLDIAIFYLSVIIAFVLFYRLAVSCKAENMKFLLYLAVGAIALLFIVFTFYPPDIALFQPPS